MDHKGIQVNFNERISQGVGATGVEDSSTQTAMHKGTQTDLSHLMNQFYLRYTEERVPLRAADQQHLCTAVENADLCTEVDLNSQVVSLDRVLLGRGVCSCTTLILVGPVYRTTYIHNNS
jgi:hypothetical protein